MSVPAESVAHWVEQLRKTFIEQGSITSAPKLRKLKEKLPAAVEWTLKHRGENYRDDLVVSPEALRPHHKLNEWALDGEESFAAGAAKRQLVEDLHQVQLAAAKVSGVASASGGCKKRPNEADPAAIPGAKRQQVPSLAGSSAAEVLDLSAIEAHHEQVLELFRREQLIAAELKAENDRLLQHNAALKEHVAALKSENASLQRRVGPSQEEFDRMAADNARLHKAWLSAREFAASLATMPHQK